MDKTLRVDYLFVGNAERQCISLDELVSLPGWAGRRHSLDRLPLEGNGDLTMTDKESGKVIYRTSFSSLFQEWLGEKEARQVTRGFENTFLVPYPKRTGIDLAILAEGYTADEMDLFYKDAQDACDAIFAHEPFKRMKNKFNVVAVESVSQDSGVSIPRKGEWKHTAVGSHFDTFYSDRYLTTRSVKVMHNWLAGIPYEHIIILANTDTYGGGGIYNAYLLTTAHHAMFKPVVVHEFGHSFGGLADEYAYEEAPSPLYPYAVEPWEPNITTLKDFGSKWKDMIPEGTPIPTPVETDSTRIYTQVGVYEGAGYTLKGIYRPTTECRMKINEAPCFCPVCERALERMIRFYTE